MRKMCKNNSLFFLVQMNRLLIQNVDLIVYLIDLIIRY